MTASSLPLTVLELVVSPASTTVPSSTPSRFDIRDGRRLGPQHHEQLPRAPAGEGGQYPDADGDEGHGDQRPHG
jgi:hypothetical protein